MSINSALLTGVSGLVANSSALTSISANIANVNTVGYKRVQTDFQDVITASTLSVGKGSGGVSAVTRNLLSEQGDIQQTQSKTDLAISGSGFFVVTDKAEDIAQTDARSFTRAGSFTPNSAGYLQNSAGLYLQGWLADANGDIITDPSDLSKLQSINVASFGGTADATTKVTLNANLNAGQAVSAAVAAMPAGTGAYNATTNNMSQYLSDPTTGVKPDYTLQVPVSDSKGGQRTLQISFLKSQTPNTWYAEVTAVPASTVTTADGLVASGTVTFNTDGKLASTSGLFTDPTNPVLDFAASGSGSPGLQWADGLGISAQSITLNLDQAPGGLTQYSSKSVVQSIATNGTSFGNLDAIDIDANGFVTASYDNGVTRQIAQVAVATFPNPDGLRSISGDAYRVSLNSGTYNLKQPGSGGAGSLNSSALEASTVDLSSEFTGLITTQRAYSASSKIITTADQMLQELIDIKR
jgi:flagellar hook protein FlgE